VWISPRVVPWIAPAALAVVFVLSFFPWVGMYPGGLSVYTQSAWEAAFGSYWDDPVFWGKVKGREAVRPGASVWAIFFLLFLLLALVVAFAAVILPRTQVKLPPAVEKLWPWRMAILGGLTVLAFLCLVAQLVTGFAVENAVRSEIAREFEGQRKAAKTEEDHRIVDLREGMELDSLRLHRTVWLRLAVLFHLVAIAGVGLDLWLERRGRTRPLPRMDTHW
jgi:hypothetical protein